MLLTLYESSKAQLPVDVCSCNTPWCLRRRRTSPGYKLKNTKLRLPQHLQAVATFELKLMNKLDLKWGNVWVFFIPAQAGDQNLPSLYLCRSG